MKQRFGLTLLCLVVTTAVFRPTPSPAQTRVIPKKEPPVIQIVKRDASVIKISPDSVSICGRNARLELGNGQEVDFDKMKMLEVLGIQGKSVKLRLTLRKGGDPIEFSLDCDYQHAGGQNDLGPVELPLGQINRIVFP